MSRRGVVEEKPRKEIVRQGIKGRGMYWRRKLDKEGEVGQVWEVGVFCGRSEPTLTNF